MEKSVWQSHYQEPLMALRAQEAAQKALDEAKSRLWSKVLPPPAWPPQKGVYA